MRANFTLECSREVAFRDIIDLDKLEGRVADFRKACKFLSPGSAIVERSATIDLFYTTALNTDPRTR